MKKISIILALVMSGFVASAQVDDIVSAGTTIATAGYTNTYTVSGVIEGALITIPSSATATVSIATSSGTSLFTGTNLTASTDGYTAMRFPVYNSNGTALTNTTGAVVDKIGVYDTVVFTVNPAAGVTTTNAYSVKLIVNK